MDGGEKKYITRTAQIFHTTSDNANGVIANISRMRILLLLKFKLQYYIKDSYRNSLC